MPWIPAPAKSVGTPVGSSVYAGIVLVPNGNANTQSSEQPMSDATPQPTVAEVPTLTPVRGVWDVLRRDTKVKVPGFDPAREELFRVRLLGRDRWDLAAV